MSLCSYNTCDFDESKRFSYWHDTICDTYLTVQCEQLTAQPLDGSITVQKLGLIGISDVISPAMEYRRQQAEIQRTNEEYFQLIRILEGKGYVEQNGKQAVIHPGEMVIYSSTDASKVRYPHGSRTQVVKIPRAALMDRIDGVDRLMAHTLKGNSPVGRLTKSLINESINISFLNDRHTARFSNGLLDIVATLVETELSLELSDHTPAFTLVTDYIEQHLSDPELNVGQIACLHNVSVRTLNRIFASEGTTVMRWILTRRLANCYRILSEGQSRQVSQVAYQYGFNDLSHFSKVFKKRYGVSPNTVRQMQA